MTNTRKKEKKNKKNEKNKKIYTRKHYNSNDGMITSVWGPGAWHFLHTISFNYPVHPTKQEKKEYMNFIFSMKNVLPCGKCRKNFKKNLKTLPLTLKAMKSRATFSKYVYSLHEVVNKMLGKKSNLTYEQVKERYEHFRARCVVPLEKLKFEDGCTEPLYGEKSKCILKIVPQKEKCETFQVADTCIIKK